MSFEKLISRALSLSQLDQNSSVFVVNHGYAGYLKLGSRTDSSNDRYAYAHEGDRGSDDARYTWKITSVGNDQYSLQNFSVTCGFLFRGAQADSIGDYTIWGHNTRNIDISKGDRYKFTFTPVGGGGNIYNIFTENKYIIKAGVKRDEGGDHNVYAQRAYETADRFQWILVPAP